MKFKSHPYPEHLAKTGPEAIGLKVSRAEGAYVYDENDRPYLDMISGIAVMNLGHQHPKIIEAIIAQVNKHCHVMVYGEFLQSSTTQLASELASLLPNSLNTSYFVNSGTEANEGALKLARRHTGRSKIIACHGAYHGSTMGSLSVSGNEKKKAPFRPLIPDVHFIRHNVMADLEEIDSQTAAVIIEPIQGDAGVRIADTAYLQALSKRCKEKGALLIFDEIQSGIGRTGKLFSFMHHDVVPDILTAGKALGGGLPIGCFITSAEIMRSLQSDPPLGHITTFGGNPVSCAAALACLKLLSEELLESVERKADLLEKELQHPKIKAIRRKGLMFAIELYSEDAVQFVIHRALEKGLILFWFLSLPSAFRLAPPLNISEKEILFATKTIREILNEYNEKGLET